MALMLVLRLIVAVLVSAGGVTHQAPAGVVVEARSGSDYGVCHTDSNGECDFYFEGGQVSVRAYPLSDEAWVRWVCRESVALASEVQYAFVYCQQESGWWVPFAQWLGGR